MPRTASRLLRPDLSGVATSQLGKVQGHKYTHTSTCFTMLDGEGSWACQACAQFMEMGGVRGYGALARAPHCIRLLVRLLVGEHPMSSSFAICTPLAAYVDALILR